MFTPFDNFDDILLAKTIYWSIVLQPLRPPMWMTSRNSMSIHAPDEASGLETQIQYVPE
jgi:hypothetical protein